MEKEQPEEVLSLPDEMGEETVLDNNDDGTVSSKILHSEKDVVPSSGTAAGETTLGSDVHDAPVEKTQPTNKKEESGIPINVEFNVNKNGKPPMPQKISQEEPVKIENEKVTEEKKNDEPEERDFDKNPTVLYALVQKKLWKEALERVKARPDEASIWVSRREKDGKLRWRLLPLHAAIVFKASEEVVENLLTAYSKAAQGRDDQGMLPLHLAFRNGASEAVVNLLLVAYPQSVDIPDRKGRVPLTLAQAAASPHREVYIKALEKGPSHYAIAAVAAARANIIAEQKEIQDAKLNQVRQFHEYEMNELKAEEEKKHQEIEERVAELESELAKTQETSQVLVDHVNSLEAQLSSRSDTERFLATKIANLDEKLKQTERLKEEIESRLSNEKMSLTEERDNLLTKVEELETKLSSTEQKLAETQEILENKESEWTKTEKELRETLQETEVEWANSQASSAILEAQLKKRMENEHLLATQVSTLASRLAESACDSKENCRKYTEIIRVLEEDRFNLKDTVHDLTRRLKEAASAMHTMHEQQMQIVDDAIAHEEMVSKALEAHAKIMSDSVEQEKELLKAKEEREQMRQLLNRQEESHDLVSEKRSQVVEIISTQGKCIANTKEARDSMLSNVQEMNSSLTSALHTVMGGIEIGKKKIGSEYNFSSSEDEIEETTPAVAEEEPAVVVKADSILTSRTEDAGEKLTLPQPETTVDVASKKAITTKVADLAMDMGPEEMKVTTSAPLQKLNELMKELNIDISPEPVVIESRTEEVVRQRSDDNDRIIESREM